MKNTAIEEIRSTLKKLDYDIDNININVSVPKNKKFGDLSTNIAFIISKKINLPTMEVATIISNKLEYYKNIDKTIFNMTSMRNTVWFPWIYLAIYLARFFNYAKSTNASSCVIDNSDVE